MGGKRAGILEVDALRGIASEVAELVGDTVRGDQTWDQVCGRLAAALPGSAVSLLSYEMPTKTVTRAFQVGIDQDYVDSYAKHYSRINPWMEFWAAFPERSVAVSERDCPVSLIRDSEFYHDWLAPQGNLEAAVGVRFDSMPHEAVHLVWHYPLDMAPEYDVAAAFILERLVEPLAGAVELQAMLRAGFERGLRNGALVERIGEIAILITPARAIVEGNSDALAAFSKAGPVSATGNILAIRHPPANQWFENALHQIAIDWNQGSSAHVFSVGSRIFRITVTPVPDQLRDDRTMLLPMRRLVLVTVRLLVGGRFRLDSQSIKSTFLLSASELRLCDLLVNGYSLRQAASILRVSEGTVRQRIKLIFQKTRTHRQSELVSLLVQMSDGATGGD